MYDEDLGFYFYNCDPDIITGLKTDILLSAESNIIDLNQERYYENEEYYN